jgi:phenylpyruvate tautomerase PptA (4-oxalocrotonate tautomerase family)
VPLVRLETTEKLPPDRKTQLCARLSRICAETIGKDERWQMAIVVDGLTVHFGGKPGPAAFVDIRSLDGLTPKVNQALSEKMCRLLEEELHVPAARVYLNMRNVPADDWGHDGGTFGGT